VSAQEVLCIIPARGGSVRIPGKNLRQVCGRSLLSHTVSHALDAERVTRVVVSTDCPKIAHEACETGAEVVFRGRGISGPTSPSEAALLHALDELRKREGYDPDLVVFLQCTAPIREAADIDRAVATLEEDRADSLLSVSEVKLFLWREASGFPAPANYDLSNRPRTQEFEPQLVENGSIYVCRTDHLRATGNRLGGKISLYRMAAISAIDVDDEQDLWVCEAVMKRMIEENRS
jgi:CMP-N,N'-diacetyllegionaminic acid synthase